MIEYEVKVLDIEPESITAALENIGFRSLGKRNFKRAIFDVVPARDEAWLRLRTDGKQTTLTLKQFVEDSIDGVEEYEVEVSSFSETLTIMQKAGFEPKKTQENSRMDFQSDQITDVEISIDWWPGIPPYLEIEGPNVEAVENMLVQLGVSEKRTTSITTAEVYRLYGKEL